MVINQPHMNGNRSSDDMLKFCLKNLNLEKILNVYTGNKYRTIKGRIY